MIELLDLTRYLKTLIHRIGACSYFEGLIKRYLTMVVLIVHIVGMNLWRLGVEGRMRVDNRWVRVSLLRSEYLNVAVSRYFIGVIIKVLLIRSSLIEIE
jgi:hypothetical protein